eukprot:scaffold22292_cov62-Phaeocystis_antarctica.AAC.4
MISPCVPICVMVILYVDGHNPFAVPVFRLGPQQTHMSIMPVVPRCAADASKRPAVSASLRLVLSFCVTHRVPPLSPPAGPYLPCPHPVLFRLALSRRSFLAEPTL